MRIARPPEGCTVSPFSIAIDMNPPLPPKIAPAPPVPRPLPTAADTAGAAQTRDPRRPLEPGTRVGNYTILRTLGQGGFGITYLATTTGKSSRVVLKEHIPAGVARREEGDTFIRCTSVKDEEDWAHSLSEFKEEVSILTGLHHEGIVPILDSFEANGTGYYVMPYIHGKTLTLPEEPSLEAAARRQEARLHRRLLLDLLPIFSYLGQNGVVHRDVKPENIIITPEGKPKLLDFGSARQVRPGRSFTNIYTPAFAAPEQTLSFPARETAEHIDPRTDIYQLGATVYYLVTRMLPPAAGTRLHAEPDPYAPLAERPELVDIYGRTFLAGIDRAMQLHREDRWPSAAEWLSSLSAGTSASQHRLPRGLMLGIGLGLCFLGGSAALVLHALQRYREGRELAQSCIEMASDTLMETNLMQADIPGATERCPDANVRLNTYIETLENTEIGSAAVRARGIARARLLLAGNHLRMGENAEALAQAERCLASLDGLREQDAEPRKMMHRRGDGSQRYETMGALRARAHCVAADALLRAGREADAAKHLVAARALYDAASPAQAKSPIHRLADIQARRLEADLARDTGHLRKQLNLLLRNLEAVRSLYEALPDMESAALELGHTLISLAEFYAANEQWDESNSALREARMLFANLYAAHPYSLESLYGLALAYTRLFEVEGSRNDGKLSESVSALLSSSLRFQEQHAQELIRMDPGNATFLALYAETTINQMRFAAARRQWNRVESTANAFLRRLDAREAQPGTSRAEIDLLRARTLCLLALAHTEIPERASAAAKEYEQAYALVLREADRARTDHSYAVKQARLCKMYADYLFGADKTEEACAVVRRGLEILDSQDAHAHGMPHATCQRLHAQLKLMLEP